MKTETKKMLQCAAVGAGVAATIAAILYFKNAHKFKKALIDASNASGARLTLGRLGANIKTPTEKLSALGFKALDEYDGAYEMVTEYGMSVSDLAKAAEALKELDGVNEASKIFAVFNVQREGGTFGRYVDKFAAAANK